MNANRYGDFYILTIAVAGILFGIGEWVGRTQRLQFYCEPGYVKAARYQDGSLVCFYERSDWRRPVEKRIARRVGT